MKKIKKTSCPDVLTSYIVKHPIGDQEHSWSCFCENTVNKRSVQKQIKIDQRGLCAYCELDFLEVPAEQRTSDGKGIKPDFRVDHFHPKSDMSVPGKNWHLDWHNLLGCCTGGDERNVVDSKRFIDEKTKRHCDAKKGDRVLDNIILNPLTEVPAFPCLWSISENSTEDEIILEASQDACNSVSEDCYCKAKNTLDELNLNCSLLARFRCKALKRVQSHIKDKILSKISAGKVENQAVEEAIEEVMQMLYEAKPCKWPPFFSTIRAKYAFAAEKQLKAIGYDG